MPRPIHAFLVLLLVVVACGNDPSANTDAPATTASPESTTTTTEPVEMEATGTVIVVDGTLAGIEEFTLRLEDGTDLRLVPADGLLFDGTAPLSHVRDHLVSGSPVTVTYLAGGEPPFTCTEIGDAAGDGHSHDD